MEWRQQLKAELPTAPYLGADEGVADVIQAGCSSWGQQAAGRRKAPAAHVGVARTQVHGKQGRHASTCMHTTGLK